VPRPRLHVDVNATGRNQAAELERFLGLGARPAEIGQTGEEPWRVLSDPEGDEFCFAQGPPQPAVTAAGLRGFSDADRPTRTGLVLDLTIQWGRSSTLGGADNYVASSVDLACDARGDRRSSGGTGLR
jgi:hypothetical protein